MTSPAISALPSVSIAKSEVFSLSDGEPNETYLEINDWSTPVTYFVGRNGSGKSRTARVLKDRLDGRLLSTDRLAGLMNFSMYGWGAMPAEYRGVPIDEQQSQQIAQISRGMGSATDELYALREEPEVWLRVAAFIRRTLGRSIELRESAGFLDPFVRVGDSEYSLLRDEGHGLRELVILLAATYRPESPLLIVDEPELHLHPSMARLWLTELNRECEKTGRRGIVVTHEPAFLKPKTVTDLSGIWMFGAGRRPSRLSDSVLPVQADRVAASLGQNPQLVGQIAFSPRPVLVEGVTDVAALSTALARLVTAEVVAQTDLVECGGSGSVGMWLEICTKLELDVRAVSDLDALFAPDVQRAIDALPGVSAEYVRAFATEPGRTSKVVEPLVTAANREGVGADPAQRATWLAAQGDPDAAVVIRRDRILQILQNHGLWVHPQGTLEDVLELAHKGVAESRLASGIPGPIDAVALWCAYDLDLMGDVKALLGIAVEHMAHAIMEAQRAGATSDFHSPVGGSAKSDSRLADVTPLGGGRHRITVKLPREYEGYWVEFSRETPSAALELQSPVAGESPVAGAAVV